MSDVVIVGAGIAGLRCARRLATAGVRAVVLEKSRGVGGRCATRRVDDVPVDHGPAFFHGRDDGFLAALRDTRPATRLDGWPERVRGRGKPCQPRALAPAERRLAFAEGANRFAKHLASDVDVRLRTRVEAIEPAGDGWTIRVAEGAPVTAPIVVVALPTPQAAALLSSGPASAGREVEALVELLKMATCVPCLTVLAGYAVPPSPPEWDVFYPEESRIVQMVSNESSKRAGETLNLVAQALPVWSAARWERTDDEWSAELVEELGRLAGDWASRPVWVQPKRWRYARSEGASEFAVPPLVSIDGRRTIGLTGESFAPGGGAQAAWLAGGAIAERILKTKGNS